MASGFLDKFRRVTSSTGYLPEVDGLRFLAIFWVTIPMHAVHYLDEKFYQHGLIRPGFWKDFIMEGTHGMYLFFMISGFILGLPFARAHLLEGGRGISLKRYYLRRLTRLEPPYIIALIVFFLAHLFVVGKYPLEQLVPSFFASLIYSHGLIFHEHPLLLPVAWSLEIEVQFYILAPLFCLLFKLKNAWVRRGILGVLILAGPYYHLYVSEAINLARFAHYFFAGLLLTDLYVTRAAGISSSRSGYWIGVASLVALFVFVSYYTLPGLMVKLLILMVLFHQVLFNERFRQLFTLKGVTIIGGMCYSIYLLHFGLISAVGQWVLSSGISLTNYNHAPLYLLAFTALILLISGIYFYFIEKPFMKFNVRRWDKKKVKVPAV